MVSSASADGAAVERTNRNLNLVEELAHRLRRRYGWVELEELRSYAYLGLALAARAYEADRGLPFVNYAARKALYLAVDEMRRDRLVCRADADLPSCFRLQPDLRDPHGDGGHSHLERRDLLRTLLEHIGDDDRRLLMMRYADELTFREIAEVLGRSESAVCIHHQTLLDRLRQTARRRGFC